MGVVFPGRAYVPISMIEWGHLGLREESDMAIRKTIRTKMGSVEKQLARRVSSLEKDVARLMKKLEKKEHEIKKLKHKLTSGQIKNVKKKVMKAKKAVRKHLPGIR
jgi:predicted  nucleic acid-binding Zn-ribbon protein